MHAITNRHPLTDAALLRAKEQIKSSVQLFILTFGMGCFFVAGTLDSFTGKVSAGTALQTSPRAVPVTGHRSEAYVTNCTNVSDLQLRKHQPNVPLSCLETR